MYQFMNDFIYISDAYSLQLFSFEACGQKTVSPTLEACSHIGSFGL